MRRSVRGSVLMVVLGGATAFGVLAACLGEDVSAGGSDVPSDAAADGARTSSDAGGAAASVLPRGDFESAGCLGWTPNEATLTAETDAHGGSFHLPT